MPEFGRLLPSQEAFMSFPQRGQARAGQSIFLKCDCGGWSSGKSMVCITQGLLLSNMFPGNQGLIARLRGKDLEDSIIPLFFELCPESWIWKVTDRGHTGMNVILKNRSIIYFRHIRDANATGNQEIKTRRVGSNLGWFFVSQAEEMERGDFNALQGRLRNPKALIKMGLLDANPNGRNWVQQDFFPNWKPIDISKGKFFVSYVSGNKLGIHVNSEENRISNGGFVDDDFYDSMVANMPPEVYKRYVAGSMEDFTGKIYKDFYYDLQKDEGSVHVLRREFSIPKHWDCLGPIDVGGACPWSVLNMYVDEKGNLIVVDEFDKATGRTGEVIDWIKTHMPWNENRTSFIIDPENKVASVELSDAGIWCRNAIKDVLPGILRTAGYFYCRPLDRDRFGNLLEDAPEWFLRTQPEEMIERVRKEGCPRIFVFRRCTTFIKEHDSYVWDDKKPNTPKKTAVQRFNSCFVGETPVLLANGLEKPISDIVVGDYVLTRVGPRRVLNAALTQKDANVLCITFSNSRQLRATPNHKIWHGNGWAEICNLKIGDEVLTCDQNPYFMAAMSSDYTKTSSTTLPESTAELGNCIVMSGTAKQTKFQTQKNLQSTTKTITKTTLPSPTLKKFQSTSIHTNIIPTALKKHEPPLRVGTDQQRAELGIGSTSKIASKKYGTIQSKESAMCVKRNFSTTPLTQDSVGTTANRNGDGIKDSTTKRGFVFNATRNLESTSTLKRNSAPFPVRVVGVERAAATEDVFNITVEGQHEFYANGVLAKNCDSIRYGVMLRPLASNLPKNDKYAELRAQDVYSAQEAEANDREIAAILAENSPNNLSDAFTDVWGKPEGSSILQRQRGMDWGA